MKKMTFVLLAALAIVVTSCKPKENTNDVSLSITNEYDAQVMNTLYSQFSTDSAAMMDVIRNTLGYVEGVGTSNGGGHLCYRKGEFITKKNQPWIHIHFNINNCKKVKYVRYYSYSTNSIADRSQMVKGFNESLTVAGVTYNFANAEINTNVVEKYQDMISSLGSVSSAFSAHWKQDKAPASFWGPSMVTMSLANDTNRSRTQLYFVIDSPVSPE